MAEPAAGELPPPRLGDAKVYFSSERTFLHWLSISVTLGGLAAASLGLAGEAHSKWGAPYERPAIAVRLVGLLVLAAAIALAMLATWEFHTRGERLKRLSDGAYDSRLLPWIATSVFVVVLFTVWCVSVVKFVRG